MIDSDGYPTEETLQKIREWDTFKDLPGFVDYVCENWYNGFPPKLDREKGCLQLSTAGWSGCESVIGAMRDNKGFWWRCWYQTRCGGHHWFRIKGKL
jgi:hypothetical protein